MPDEPTMSFAARAWAELKAFFPWVGTLAAGGLVSELLRKRREDRRAVADTKQVEAATDVTLSTEARELSAGWKEFAENQVRLLTDRVAAQARDLAAQATMITDLTSQLTESLTRLGEALTANQQLAERNQRLEAELENLRKLLTPPPAVAN